MSTIESSVTRLLVATKHLLESLTQWAKGSASETDISDSYVQLGNEFKVACRAFSNAGVDVSDLGDVPHSLRVVLEEALCEAPSQDSLDKFLPSIREIIVSLLQNLKTKQALARTIKANKSRDSLRSTASEDQLSRRSSVQSQQTKVGSIEQARRRESSSIGAAAVSSSTSSQSKEQPPKAPNNALAQLQKGDSLQRRASRRFSAYQYAKLTSYSPGKDPELPDQSILERSKGQLHHSVNRLSSSDRSPEIQTPGTINVFLKIGDRVKKSPLTIPTSFTGLRLLFVEKFAYSPVSGQFPDIYVLDKESGISYELEDTMFSDVEEGSVISLNVNKNSEILEAVNKNIDDLKEQLKSKQQEFFQSTRGQITESHNELLKQLRTIVEAAAAPTESDGSTSKSDNAAKNAPVPKPSILADMSDLLNIRHEISVIKQINNTNKASFKESIEKVLQKVKDFKSLSLDASKASTRTYMEESHQKLSKDSDELLTKFDDLQDLIEALRKDVAQRGARPSEKQLDYVNKQLNEAQADLSNMVEYINTEKPNWKKIWESELDTVCQEQQFLTLQEDLAFDLKEDLEKATETFELVKQCCLEQTKNPRTRTANFPLAEPGSLPNIRDALLSEVEALKPNHDSRVEAIERAEKLRAKERQLTIMNGFEEELGGFVDDNKLKKSGGIEEVERVRRMKDEQNLRSNFPPPF
jgi:hypothetical protein